MSERRHHDDERFANAFRALRERDRSRAPSFERVLGRRPRRAAVPRWAPALVAAALLLLAVGLWRGRGAGSGAAMAFRIEAGQLRMPTDFLLEGSLAELPGRVPSFGRIDDWFGLPALDERGAGPSDESERL